MAKFSMIGVYRIVPTLESILEAVHYHQFGWLLNRKGGFRDVIYWDSFKDLVLIEMEIEGEFSPLELSTISQDDQAPYMEFYLDNTGTRFIPENQAVKTKDRRVCFFLHALDVTKPLRIGSGTLPLLTISDLPDRLKPFAHYLPVD